MAQLATQARFEAGAWYSDYSTVGSALAALRLPWYLAQAPAAPARIAIAGSGWGHSVKALRDAGRDASGFDASSYASLRYVTLEPGQAGRNVVANVLNSTQMTNYRRNTVGMPGTKKIPLMVSEDLLPCLTDAEVATAIAQMRNNATEVIHVITCAVPSDTDPLEAKTGDLVSRSADFNWKTHAEWKRLVGTELVMNAEDGSVL